MIRSIEWIPINFISPWARRGALLLLVLTQFFAVAIGTAPAEEAHWIWSPKHKKESVPVCACHFRKAFTTADPDEAQILIAADDQYELFINGRRVGAGNSHRQLDEYVVTEFVKSGRNVIAVKVTNRRGPSAALVARVLIKEKSGGWTSHSTDKTWITNLRPLPLWTSPLYNDRFWAQAQSFGQLGNVVPWDRQEDVASDQTDQTERFRIGPEFEVQRVVGAEQTGSLIAMAFNEFGHIIASREGGPLLLIHDSDDDQIVDEVRVYCEQVKNVQGILPLNGDVFVTADGPEGNGFYRLSDNDRDGDLESVTLLFNFEGEMGEHGAHGLTLGPDGWIYIVVGNHTLPLKELDKHSPYRNFYEGDLVGPRYEDPGGHAAGRRAPGGCIIRTDLQGSTVQLVAGGLRNVYDLAFSPSGELFVHDSDMESDEGTTWYRPTRICEVAPSAEFGWRSGWAKWPDYYIDSLPSAVDTGRGSPTGAVFYNHHMFPRKFQNTLFLADWSEGRILVADFKRDGASYKAHTEVFLQGQPLNVTDLDVGPDGWLYYVTGGRGTGGGVYRVTWKGKVPASYSELGTGISPAIRQPQMQSAWGRQQIARIRNKIGEDWGPMLLGVVRSTANSTNYRIRALDLMRLYGPTPTAPLLVELAQDKNESIRAKAAKLMGVYSNDETGEQLVRLLKDSDRMVRRKACESLVEAGQSAPINDLLPMLASDDRFEAWAARRLLEATPTVEWAQAVLESSNHRVFTHGALALVTADPSESNALLVLDRIRKLMDGFISDQDFINMLRVSQVAILRGRLVPQQLTGIRDLLAAEYPAGDAVMNRELTRLLVYLQAGSIIDRYLQHLESDIANPEKVHLAVYLRFLENGWTGDQKFDLLKFLATASEWEGGSSYRSYVDNAARDFARQLTPFESVEVLKQGDQWPAAALGALYKVPPHLDDEIRKILIKLDKQIDGREDSTSKQLMVGIVAVLARSGDEASMAYLREIWERSPSRRKPVIMGLAQSPGGENWPYLVQSLPIISGGTAVEVLRRLNGVEQVPDDPEYFRQVILSGLRGGEPVAKQAVILLEKWSGAKNDQPSGATSTAQLAAWQTWFAKVYPDQLPAELPEDADDSKWKFDELLEQITSLDDIAPDAARGADVFERGECIKCHRMGDRGEPMGPDLSTISKRFTREEILQSILFPSHIIPSQYVSRTLLLMDGRQVAGIVTPGAEGEKTVLQSDGEKVSILEVDIDEELPSKISAMPTNLLNELTLQDIADLFEYMRQTPAPTVAERHATEVAERPSIR